MHPGPRERKDLGKAIIDGIVHSETAKDNLTEIGDLALHQLLDEEVWRDVPIIRSIVGIVKGVCSVRDTLFVKKVLEFFRGCPRFSNQEREDFMQAHLADPKMAKKLGDTLVLILDRLDDLDKPEMVSKVFAAVVRGKIPMETFRRLAAAIDIGFVEDLKALASQPFDHIFAVHHLLVRTGLVQMSDLFEVKEGAFEQSAGASYQITKFGKIFIGCMNENYDFRI